LATLLLLCMKALMQSTHTHTHLTGTRKAEFVFWPRSWLSWLPLLDVCWLGAGQSGFGGSIPGRDWEFFSSPPLPYRFGGPHIFLSDGYRQLFPLLVPRSKSMCRYIFIPITSSWRGA